MVEVTNRKGQTKIKPLAIYKYNQYISGVDKQDQTMSYYPCERWYKKIGIHFFSLHRVTTIYFCPRYDGEPALCLENCFEEFHS